MIKKISIPFLALHAVDDPICQDKFIPYKYFTKKLNKNIIFMSTVKGGHIAWIEGNLNFNSKRRWYPKPVLQFLNLSKVIKKPKKIEPPSPTFWVYWKRFVNYIKTKLSLL